MKVYIEYVIINNLFVNLLILYLSGIVLRRRVRWWRLLVSSIIGTVYACLLPYISFNYDIFLKIFLSIIMVLVAYSSTGFADYMILLSVFYLITFVFGGTIIGIGYLASNNLLNMLIYPSNITIGILSLSCMLSTIFIRYLVHIIRLKMRRESLYYDVILSHGNNSVTAKAYMDSGNRLYYRLNYVIPVSENVFNRLYAGLEDIKSVGSIDIRTVSGVSKCEIFRIDSVELIGNKGTKYYRNICIAKAKTNFDGYEVLLHSDM